MGLLAVVVSSQAGVARVIMTQQRFGTSMMPSTGIRANYGARIDAYYFCLHHPEHGEIRHCTCREPAPGLLIRAAHDLDIDAARSWLVGDKAADIEAGIAAGARPTLVETGYGKNERMLVKGTVTCVRDLRSAAECIAPEFAICADK